MKRWWLLGLCALLPAHAAMACGLNTHIAPFEIDAGAEPTDAPEDTLQSPELRITEITRGLGGAPGTCDGSGLLGLRLDWPRGEYSLDQVGFEFRIVSSNNDMTMFPTAPVKVITDSRRANVLFFWTDVAPSQQQPLRVEVEVRAVTKGYVRGPATRLIVDSSEN